MKHASFWAGICLLAFSVVALLSGCGGGNSLSPTPTPTALATNTPLPTATSGTGPQANLTTVTQSNDGSSFGPSHFSPEASLVSGGPLYTVAFGIGESRSISFQIPNPSTLTLGTTYDLASSQATMLATLLPEGAPSQTFWGGKGYSQGRLRIVGLTGERFTCELQDVVLTRQPATSSPTSGTSQLKVSGSFSADIPAD